jgi:pantothenate synthetase
MRLGRPTRPDLYDADDEQLAFSDSEIKFIDAGMEVDVTVTNFKCIANKLKCDTCSGHWEGVEKIISDLLCTRIRPGFFKAVAESGIGMVVAYVFSLMVRSTM